jgi:hypothetical protein
MPATSSPTYATCGTVYGGRSGFRTKAKGPTNATLILPSSPLQCGPRDGWRSLDGLTVSLAFFRNGSSWGNCGLAGTSDVTRPLATPGNQYTIQDARPWNCYLANFGGLRVLLEAHRRRLRHPDLFGGLPATPSALLRLALQWDRATGGAGVLGRRRRHDEALPGRRDGRVGRAWPAGKRLIHNLGILFVMGGVGGNNAGPGGHLRQPGRHHLRLLRGGGGPLPGAKRRRPAAPDRGLRRPGRCRRRRHLPRARRDGVFELPGRPHRLEWRSASTVR